MFAAGVELVDWGGLPEGGGGGGCMCLACLSIAGRLEGGGVYCFVESSGEISPIPRAILDTSVSNIIQLTPSSPRTIPLASHSGAICKWVEESPDRKKSKIKQSH